MPSVKARYWSSILYPENMIDNWESEIGDLVQVPYCYAIHDKDLDKEGAERKVHVHLMLVFPNTTTQKHALTVANVLSRSINHKCASTIEPVFNVRYMYNYLIHDTDTCRKKEKYLYPVSYRHSGNNFDIGSFEQISLAEKNDMAKELCDVIIRENFTNFIDFYCYVVSNFEISYFDVIKSYSGLFERLTKGCFQKANFKK